MDFLDPDKMKRHNLMVVIGYGLVAIAIGMASLVLLYQSYGYGINREGEVIQNGLVFTASTPSGASVYLNSEQTDFQTDKRLVLAAGEYLIQYRKDGYWPWARSINVVGSGVSRYDYAFLFPRQLDTTTVQNYASVPTLSTQSPDRRWLLLQRAGTGLVFDVFDLKNPTVAAQRVTLPSTLISSGKTSQWEVVDWANDNRHLLLKHTYDNSTEFIMVDRTNPTSSFNLNTQLNVDPTSVSLVNEKYDRYYLYTSSTHLLQVMNLSDQIPRNYLRNVLAYKSYGDQAVLYVTDDIKETADNKGKVQAKYTDGSKTYNLRQLAAGSTYLLDMAEYSGKTYVAIGSNAEDKVVVYRNPIDQINDSRIGVPVQVSTLKVDNPNYLQFSNNARFIMAEHGTQFAVYDAEEDKTYRYAFETETLDKPQKHAEWMDANHLMYISDGKLFVFDYDQTNRHSLQAALPSYSPAFTPDFRRVFSVAPQTANPKKAQMTSTWLRISTDR
ncbi:PEGA domain-containing protein [Candidatus Saccharibacteria bacterium]|nr:PEGA domain-containing protein [Candidatus Saccharibacteria bacterium]